MNNITVNVSGNKYTIDQKYIREAKNWFRLHQEDLPQVSGTWHMGIFLGNNNENDSNASCKSVQTKLNGQFRGLNCWLEAENIYFFAPFVIDENNNSSFGEEQNNLDGVLKNGDFKSSLLYTISDTKDLGMFEYKDPNRRRGNIFDGGMPTLPFIAQANRKGIIGMKKISISEDLYRSRGEEIAGGREEKNTSIPGIAMLFSTTIRDLSQRNIKPILQRFNEKINAAGIKPVETLNMPLIAFLGQNDLWKLDGRAIIPLEIEKKQKKGIQQIEITYLDLSTMEVKINESQELKDRVERIIIERQEMKQLRINALIKDRNAFIEKMETSYRPSSGGFPAIIFMMNKLESLLNARASTLKMQIASMRKKLNSFKQNPLLLDLEQQSEEEMTKPFGESPFYKHPRDFLTSILRDMHYQGKLEEIMRMLESGELQRKYNPKNDPRLNPVFDALIEFGRQLRENKEEKKRKEYQSKEERKERFDTGIAELPVLKEIQKINEMSVADMPIETSGISPELYKSEGSKMGAPAKAMEYIRINLTEVETTKDRLAGIRMILLGLNEEKNLNAKHFRTPKGQKDIQKIEKMFSQLHGFIQRYVNSVYRDGQIDKAKIGSSADPIANLFISEYLLILNTKVKEYIKQQNENSENRTASRHYAIKFAQNAATPVPAVPPLGGMPGMPGAGGGSKAGELRTMDTSKIDAAKHNDKIELESLQKHFSNAYEAGHSIKDSVILAIQASGSRRSPGQIDVAIVPDPEHPYREAPFIRGVEGVDLGPVQEEPKK
jgi:hypothetical protein